jgi:hypothetical protein
MKSLLTRLVVLVALLVLAVVPVAAHEGRDVGDYVLTFGWRNEPAYAGQFNGPEISIALAGAEHGDSDDHHAETFPADIEVVLQAEVTFGSETTTVYFRPQWGTTGHYIADLIPTLPGDYTFHITGTIGDVEVDEIYSSADGGFSSVEPVGDLLFPAVGDAESRLAALEARIAELEARLAALEG